MALEVEHQLVQIQAGLAAGVEGNARSESFGDEFVQSAEANSERVLRDEIEDFVAVDQGWALHGFEVVGR